MKALLLHGTNGSSSSNWLPWLDARLCEAGWHTFVPDLPRADEPDIERYNSYLFAALPWELDGETVIVGHSSGGNAALGLLQSTDASTRIHSCVCVAMPGDDLGWDALRRLFVMPFDYVRLRNQAERYVLFYSDNDPYVPLEHGEQFAKKLGAELIVQPGAGHFNLESGYSEFPELLDVFRGC